MMIREQIIQLSKLGPLPSSDASAEQIEKHQEALQSIIAPITEEEAGVLVKLFGPDECFGLAWTLLHLIETSPGWPIREYFVDGDNEWIQRLRDRSSRKRRE